MLVAALGAVCGVSFMLFGGHKTDMKYTQQTEDVEGASNLHRGSDLR